MSYSSSLFCQVLAMVPRSRFSQLVTETASEYGAKGFSSWDQLVSMLFCQLAQAKSLREISDGLAASCGKLNHLGLAKPPAKSTLSYANQKRPWLLFAKLFLEMEARFRAEAPGKKRKFRFKNRLLSLDSSTIDLCLSLFPWAKFRQTKGAVKLHLLLDHDGYFPCFAVVTKGNVGDVTVARMLNIPAQSIVAMDRGYTDYELFSQWTERDVYFVTRLKSNAAYELVERREVPRNRNVIADELIRFTGEKARQRCPHILRRVVLWDAEKQRKFVLLTNHLHFGATTIGAIYRDRWEIELFFKLLKQHLKIKTFVGTSENALKIQIWTALISVLLLKYMAWRSKHAWSFSNLIALLRWNLFTHRALAAWLDDPFRVPPDRPERQLWLPFLDSIPTSTMPPGG